MLEIIFKILGVGVGMLGAWYVSKKIAGWLSAVNLAWDKIKAERIQAELDKDRAERERYNEQIRKKINDFLGGGDA